MEVSMLQEMERKMNPIQIELEKVSFGYEKERQVLHDISFTARENESIGLIGANGMGKSTLLKLLVGLETGYQGKIYMKDMAVVPKMMAEIQEKIGYIFQDSENQLFMTNVYDEIAFAPRNYGFQEEEVKIRVEAALEQIKITHLKEKQIYKLSGGEKKLVSIATVLAMTPDIILMDEPTIALDPKNRRNLIGILNQLSSMKIIASHDLDMIMDTCTRVILIYNGKLIRDGSTDEILTDKKLLEEHGLELPLRLQ